MKYVAVFSGGLDSTTMVYDALSNGNTVHAISFNYGQRHTKELRYANLTAHKLGIKHTIVEMDFMQRLLAASGSSLVSDTEVPEGHYAAENMKTTVVPNRNMIMLSIASGIAVAEGADGVMTAVHGGDHFIYPDCRPRFFNALNASVVLGNSGFGPIPEVEEGVLPPRYVMTPYINMTKAEIARNAIGLHVPIHETWSCYKGGPHHCGRCGTCVERLQAVAEAVNLSQFDGVTFADGWPDKTIYEDDTYWKTVTA